MAQKVVIKGGDLDGAQLENAASEATLLLLKEAMEKLAKQSGSSNNDQSRRLRNLGDAADETSDEIEDLGDSVGVLRKGLGVLGTAIMSIAGMIGNIGSAVGGGVTAVSNFNEMMITTTPTITDFTGSLENSRFNILGLGTAVNSLTRIIYGNYTSFQDLSKSGILLGNMVGSLSDMYTGSGLTLDQMTSSLAANSERLAMLGTATTGAHKAMMLNARAFKNNREELLKWGMNFQEQGESFTNFLALNAYALRRRTMTEDEVVTLSQSYAINLRKLSDYSGKQVSEVQSEMEKMNLNKGFEVFLANLNDPALAERYRTMIADAGALFGDSGRELAMSIVQGKPPLTEGARKLSGVSSEITTMMQGTLNLAKTYQGDESKFADAIKAKQSESLVEINRYIDAMADISATTYAMGSPYGDALNTALEGLMKITGRISDAAGKTDAYAAAVAAYDSATASLRDAMSDMMTSFFTNETVISGLERFAEWVKEYTPIITTELERFADQIKTFDPMKYNPFDEEGRKNIYDSFWKGIENVSTTISNWWNGEQGLTLRNNIETFFRELVVTIQDMFVNSTALNTLLGIDREEVAYRQATTGANIDVENALTAALGKGVWNVSEIAGAESVGGQETYNKLMQHLGDSADDYWTMNGRIEAALESLGAKYEAGSATEDERRLFAETIANLTDPNNAPIAFRPDNPIVPAPTASKALGTLKATGYTFEPRDAVTQIHAGERVLNSQETQTFNNLNSIQSDLVKKVEELNTSMLKAVDLLKDSVDAAKATSRSIKSLGTDAMRGVGR